MGWVSYVLSIKYSKPFVCICKDTTGATKITHHFITHLDIWGFDLGFTKPCGSGSRSREVDTSTHPVRVRPSSFSLILQVSLVLTAGGSVALRDRAPATMFSAEDVSKRVVFLAVVQVLLGCLVGLIPPDAVVHFRSVLTAHLEFVQNGMLQGFLGLLVPRMGFSNTAFAIFEVLVSTDPGCN